MNPLRAWLHRHRTARVIRHLDALTGERYGMSRGAVAGWVVASLTYPRGTAAHPGAPEFRGRAIDIDRGAEADWMAAERGALAQAEAWIAARGQAG